MNCLSFTSPLDLVTVFEVLEHTPDPVAVVKNIHDQMNDNAVLIENFILAA
jgi:2-polyprenyl-3-methyl-5-hydroxy-6-metoxy-1,4-benzoquinol methylase